MNPINKEKINRMFIALAQARVELQDLAEKNKEEFLNNPHYLASTKYHFIVAIEVMVDMSNHLISKLSLGKPESYTDIFKILGQAGIFSEANVKTFVQMAKFRNLLVHLYWQVDKERVYEILKENLNDFRIFEEGIRKFLKGIDGT